MLVEPNPAGHRFQSVAMVTAEAARSGPVVLLTSKGAAEQSEYEVFLGGVDLEIAATLDGLVPPTRQIADEVARLCSEHDVATVLMLDADQCLKRWWLEAPRAMRSLGSRRPAVMFMLTRYPAKVAPTDRFGWLLRLSKGALTLVSRLTGTVQRVSGYTGRADLTPGHLVKRVRDPAICSAHSRDRAEIRAAFDLPADRKLVGIFGVITERKYVPLVFEAIERSGTDAGLLLAGSLNDGVQQWVSGLGPEQRARVFVRAGFLPDSDIDRAVAAVDVVALAMTNNGPSGFMGKALAAEVPVVSAGSKVRAEELAGTNGGEDAELDVGSFAAALRRVLTGTMPRRANPAPPTSPTEYARCLLGIADNGTLADAPATRPGGSLPSVHPRVRAAVRQAVLLVNTPLAKGRMRRAVAALPRPIRLEIAGTSDRPGWLGTNVSATARNYLDATSRWPFEDGALSFVYADNMIEHVPLDAARKLLAEAHRCLRPGGVIRLVTPDIRNHVELYLAGAKTLDEPAAQFYRDIGLVVEHPVDLVRIPIGSFGHHVGYVYDFETLDAELTRAGFASAARCGLGESEHPELAGLDKRSGEGGVQLAVEASRP